MDCHKALGSALEYFHTIPKPVSSYFSVILMLFNCGIWVICLVSSPRASSKVQGMDRFPDIVDKINLSLIHGALKDCKAVLDYDTSSPMLRGWLKFCC